MTIFVNHNDATKAMEILNNLSSSFELNSFSRIQPLFFHELLASVNAQIDHCATVYCNDISRVIIFRTSHLSVSDVFSKFYYSDTNFYDISLFC
jgi:hypothetical protein